MDMKILYIELYVSTLLAILVYVAIELFNIENKKDRSEATKAPVARRLSPAWFFHAGIVAVVVGLFAFCVSAAVGCIVNSDGSPVPRVIFITGLLNPFFFAGVPLGVYWLYRSKRE